MPGDDGAGADPPARPDGLRFTVVDGGSPEAVAVMRRFFDEIAERSGVDLAGQGHEGPFVLAEDDGVPVAGGGLRTLPDGAAEVKRMWVHPDRRGEGLGRRLLARLESLAAGTGHRVVRLDTNSALGEAVALYDRSGYRRIDRYNDNPHADLFFEKVLDPAPEAPAAAS